jgi:cytochrome c-type biogenesis protein
MAELGGLALSYAAGALSTLSPCVLPLLPIILLGALEQHAWGPIASLTGAMPDWLVTVTTRL